MDHYTVPQGLSLFMASTGASAWGPMFAMSLLSLVPLFVVFLFFQRRLIERHRHHRPQGLTSLTRPRSR